MESVAGTMLNKRCSSRKNGLTGVLTKRLQKALHLSSPVALSQHCTGSCPNLMMKRNETLEPKTGRAASVKPRPAVETHRMLCLSLSSDSARQYNALVSQEKLDDQMKQAHSAGTASSTGSLERASLFCASVSNSPSNSSMAVESLSKPKSSPWLSWLRSSHLELDASIFSVSKKCHHACLQPEDSKPGGLQGFRFLEPVLTRITDYIYVGNLRAAYSGQLLCKNSIDSIIDMSSLPTDCSLSFIPCTCSRGPQHNWFRLKVHIQGALEEEWTSLQQPYFWDINECIEASLEKRKRVLIHCRDGSSLAPTCVIQYLMVKHNMRLLAAYELVRARYPLNIQERHQDLLVGLERTLRPGEMDMASFKQAISRKMAWA
ncbi:uncharacterized protein LOC128326078 [Hemicordylus capensis]|uniref:uncharacterized protein LOC128326078 n=1 Tax=Hemicordylus capensis TaxID=884348 RepID=UPI0023046FE3|nr:uncharacterized protein LOC128326078 [Hemicordylus capensis]